MKEQLNNLTEEMVKEIKNLKDLTKETLPIVADEYIKFNILMNNISMIFFGLILLIGLCGTTYSIINGLFTNKDFSVIQLFSIFSLAIGLIIFPSCVYDYFKFKLQPRTVAIQGVIKAFKV